MIVAPVSFRNERTIFQKIQSLEFMGLMGTTIGSAAAAAGFPVMCNGANLAYSRNAYLDTGGFSGNMNFSSGDDQFLMSAIGKNLDVDSAVIFLAVHVILLAGIAQVFQSAKEKPIQTLLNNIFFLKVRNTFCQIHHRS